MLIDGIAGYQLNLAARGRFLRGGIAFGPLFMDARYVVGQGLINAYQIEKTVSEPMVMLSEEISRLIRADLKLSVSQRHWHWSSVLEDSDGRMFVNYLPIIGHDEISGEVERRLYAHRLAVVSGLDSAQSDS
jgi:hypothetical protein